MKHKRLPDQHSSSDYALVYSTDPQPKAFTHDEPIADRQSAGLRFPLRPQIHVERKGRGGKNVLVLTKLPRHETLLKDLCSRLKSALGRGGTYRIEQGVGIIEIQGDEKDQILDFLSRYTWPS